MGLNKVVLIGRLTDDVDFRYTPNGVGVGNFTLAVNRNFKNQNGQQQTDFIRCVAWRKTAEALASYQRKGDRIAVVGAIETSSYDDKETGKKVYTTQVRVDEVTFLSPVKNNNQQGGFQQQQGGFQQGVPQQQGGFQQQQGGFQQGVPQQQGGFQQQQGDFQGVPQQGGSQQQQGGGKGKVNITEDDLPF